MVMLAFWDWFLADVFDGLIYGFLKLELIFV
jgi:hypothetical protein